MLYIITGGSGSGKSEYAEQLAVDRHRNIYPEGNLYYIATMYPYDEECFQRIARHQNMRRKKGFKTLECYHSISQIHAAEHDVFLLECMSNLLANEMYLKPGHIKARGEASLGQMEDAILQPILQLEQKAGVVVVVTNEVFSDGMNCEEETMHYVKLLGDVNRKLAVNADGVAEVVCSIPVVRKGVLPC